MRLAPAWAALASHASPFVLIVPGTWAVHALIWLAFNVPYLLMDRFGWCQQYRLRKRPRDETSSYAAQLALAWRLAVEQVTQLLPLLALAYPLILGRLFDTSAESLPTALEFTVQFLIFNVVEDTGFYWVHRALHHPRLYRAIHRVHHQHIDTFSLAGEVAHPLEFLFNFLVPMMAGPVLCAAHSRTHLLSFWIWIAFRELRSTDAHSGYNLPFHPLRALAPVYWGPVGHGAHHAVHGRATNFGGYKLWDWLCGTAAADSMALVRAGDT